MTRMLDRQGYFLSKKSEGKEAAQRGKSIHDNPYRASTIFGESWRKGFDEEKTKERMIPMPDLDIVYHQVCSQTTKTDRVLSSSGRGLYDVTASLDEKSDKCTCPGYTYHGRCKHIEKVRNEICGWDEQHSEKSQTPQQEMEAVCPKCGGPTDTVRRGV